MLVDRGTAAQLFSTLENRIKAGHVRGIELSMHLSETADDGAPLTYEVDFAWNTADPGPLGELPLQAAPDAPHYKVTSIFKARYPRLCTINSSHHIDKGDEVGRLARTDNPMLEGYWVACTACTKELR